MVLKQQEIFDVIASMNESLYAKYGDEMNNDYPILSVTFADTYIFVSISIPSDVPIDLQLYNSENNDRLFDVKLNEYESFESYIKRKYNDIVQAINNIKL
jgi:hypothetical protein